MSDNPPRLAQWVCVHCWRPYSLDKDVPTQLSCPCFNWHCSGCTYAILSEQLQKPVTEFVAPIICRVCNREPKSILPANDLLKPLAQKFMNRLFMERASKTGKDPELTEEEEKKMSSTCSNPSCGLSKTESAVKMTEDRYSQLYGYRLHEHARRGIRTNLLLFTAARSADLPGPNLPLQSRIWIPGLSRLSKAR